MATQDDYQRITVRLPPDIHEKLTQAANSSAKSVNAEIVSRLEASFEAEARTPESDISALSIELMAMTDLIEKSQAALAGKKPAHELGLDGPLLDRFIAHRDATQKSLAKLLAKRADGIYRKDANGNYVLQPQGVAAVEAGDVMLEIKTKTLGKPGMPKKK